MSVNAQAAVIRSWMREVLALRPDLSPSTWARMAGVAPSTVNKALKPNYEFVTSTRTLTKLAEVVNEKPPTVNLKTSEFVKVSPRFLEVRYRSQAGFWAEVEDLSASYANTFPVMPDPRYSNWPQWLEEVQGDSADLLLAPGSFAHVVDAIEMGYAAREGDWVIVERRRAGGHLHERSVKQVSKSPVGVELWPRSTNPRWSEPLDLAGGAEGDETIEVEIVGLVIGTYRPLI